MGDYQISWPRGTTLRCARGDRSTYRVLRSANFPADAVTPYIVQETLDLLREIEDIVKSEVHAA